MQGICATFFLAFFCLQGLTSGMIFQELDYRETRLGPISLRKRRVASLDDLEVYEVKLGEAFLMSSLFTAVEIALADLGITERLRRNPTTEPLDVVVGGLGLGYTARAALQYPEVGNLLVVETLEAVIGWHQDALVPLGPELVSDSRCRFVHADFFAAAADPVCGFDQEQPGRKFDVILLDIDHSPANLLHPPHAALYQKAGLQRLADQLRPNGVFAMWSDDAPDPNFLENLSSVFSAPKAEVVTFYNPLQDRESASTVYIA